MKRNQELVRLIDMIMNEGHDKNADFLSSKYPAEYTEDSIPDMNTNRQVSNNETERKISTPVRRNQSNAGLKDDKDKKSIPLSNPEFTNVLYSLESHLKRYFNENTNSKMTNQPIKNTNIYNHDPNNQRNRPICKF